MRHYVAMAKDELGDDFRVNSSEYEYPDFDSEDEIALAAFYGWENALVGALRDTVNEEIGHIWLERVDRERYNFCLWDDDWGY